MADPLSIASGVAGLISLGIQVTSFLVQFYTTYRDRDATVARIANKLESLLHTLHSLDTALQDHKFQPKERTRIESSIQQCEQLIQELQDEYKKLREPAPTQGPRSTIKQAGRRVAYPFRQSTLQKLDEDIGELRDNLAFILNVLQLEHQATHDDTREIKSLLKLV